MRFRGILCGGYAAVLAVLLSSTAGYCSTVYTLDTGHFGTGDFGKVTTTVDGANLDVTVDVAPNYDVTTGGHWALTFDLATAGLSITGLPSPFQQDTTNGPLYTNDPYGSNKDQPFNYAITCSGGGNGIESCNEATGFSFTIVGGGALVPLLADGVYFAADICETSLNGACTGVVGADTFTTTGGGGQGGETPIPGALPLFASAIGGLGLLGWRRKQKARVAAA